MNKTDLDPSLAFTALLELDSGFRHRTPEANRGLQNRLLDAWYDQTSIKSFWAFTEHWLASGGASR